MLTDIDGLLRSFMPGFWICGPLLRCSTFEPVRLLFDGTLTGFAGAGPSGPTGRRGAGNRLQRLEPGVCIPLFVLDDGSTALSRRTLLFRASIATAQLAPGVG